MNVVLIDSHRESSELYHSLKQNAFFHVHILGDEHEALNYLRAKQADIIIIKYFLAEITGVKLAAYFRKVFPEIPVIIVSEDPSLDKWKESTQVKAIFMPLPLDLKKLQHLFTSQTSRRSSVDNDRGRSAIEELEKESLDSFDDNQDESIVVDSPDKKGEDETIVSEPQHPIKRDSVARELETRNERQQRKPKVKKRYAKDTYQTEATVITIFSPKGGVGKTTTAVNLATLLKSDLDVKTVILEFTRQTGNVLGHFPLNPSITIRDWLDRKEWPSEEELESMLLWCPTTEIAILPTQPLIDEDTHKVSLTPAHVTGIIDCLSLYFDCIIVDGGTIMDDVLFQLLDISDQVVMVSKIERETLQDCHYIPIMLERRGIDESKVIHVLNQAKKGLGISIEDALAHVGVERSHIIHFDKEVEKIPIEKEPFIIRQKRKGRYYNELWELASMLIDHPEFEEEETNSILTKLMFWNRGA